MELGFRWFSLNYKVWKSHGFPFGTWSANGLAHAHLVFWGGLPTGRAPKSRMTLDVSGLGHVCGWFFMPKFHRHHRLIGILFWTRNWDSKCSPMKKSSVDDADRYGCTVIRLSWRNIQHGSWLLQHPNWNVGPRPPTPSDVGWFITNTIVYSFNMF